MAKINSGIFMVLSQILFPQPWVFVKNPHEEDGKWVFDVTPYKTGLAFATLFIDLLEFAVARVKQRGDIGEFFFWNMK